LHATAVTASCSFLRIDFPLFKASLFYKIKEDAEKHSQNIVRVPTAWYDTGLNTTTSQAYSILPVRFAANPCRHLDFSTVQHSTISNRDLMLS